MPSKIEKPKFDVYQVVTDKVIAQLEAGAGAWHMPWHFERGAELEMPRNIRGTVYRGANPLLLWAVAESKGYTSPVWGTYKQWAEKGAQVRKGEEGALVTFWKKYDPATPAPVSDKEEEAVKGKRFVLRFYIVFNSEQVDGWTPPSAPVVEPLSDEERIVLVESFFSELGATVHHGGNRACYVPSQDLIRMPNFCQFNDALAYYGTLAHEHVHWTGHETRLDRPLYNKFGDSAYAFEELIAEWGAAFLCATLGIANQPRPDHAQYLSHWLEVLKQDKKALFTAAAQAQKAVDFLTQANHSAEEEAA